MPLPSLNPLLLAGHACVRIVTSEEPEAVESIITAAVEFGLDPWGWSAVQGLKRLTLTGEPPIPNTENAAAALVYLDRNVREPVLLLTLDLADHLADPRILRATKETIERFRHESRSAANNAASAPGTADHRPIGSRMIMVDHREDVPPIIGFLSARLEIPGPDDAELESIIRNTLSTLNRRKKLDAKLSRPDLKLLVETLRGMSRRHASQLVAEAACDDWSFDADDLPRIIDAKRRLLADSGILEFVNAPTSLNDIGGLRNLKKWLAEREAAFLPSAAEHGILPPRGILLLGVQGAGKSLSAKAIATAWKRPLMRLDPSALYDRYIGETEKRLRDALHQAEAMSPLVLWIDEIEKGFASAASESTDGGLSRRIFGTLLTWMQEHHEPVFTVATANDINALPPELLRKGRFDEIFFVDLPVAEVREQIFDIHLKRCMLDPNNFDLKALAAAADGFSGAEIEQAVRSSLTAAFSRTHHNSKTIGLETQHIIDQVRTSPPLSVTMAEDVEALRDWAKGRCVPAD